MTRKNQQWIRLAIDLGPVNRPAPLGAALGNADSYAPCARGVQQARADPTPQADVVTLPACFPATRAARSEVLTLYTGAKPCPMCAAGRGGAGARRGVYGVSNSCLAEHGWQPIGSRAAPILVAGDESIVIEGGGRAHECAALLPAARGTSSHA